jgi:histone deacetylase complex regulatory component SIN3
VPSTDCSYARTSNSVGDIIFGRTNIATTCRDVYSREDGAWYQVGRGAHNNSIYERRIRSANGSLIIQRARRNPNGTFTILSSRAATTNDKEWRKAEKARQKAWKKQQKAEEKAQRKADKEYYKHR